MHYSSRWRMPRTTSLLAHRRLSHTILVWLLVAGCASDVPARASPTPTLASGPSSPSSTATGIVTTPGATPRPTPSRETPRPAAFTSSALRDALDIVRAQEHLVALQMLADRHGDRAVNSAGFDAAVAYVIAQLRADGYEVRTEPFAFDGGTSVNVLVEREGFARDRVVMLGAHLDSAVGSPGINDNASGVATVLAIADAAASLPPPGATLRFAFWGAEEPGRHGSAAYVDGLDPDERDAIAAYVNLDIIASANFVRFVYDEPHAVPGSDLITARFAAHFDDLGLAWEPIDLTGKTDHAAFSDADIPTGGLFSGGTEPKTNAQASAFGGTPGIAADACIHRACDSLASIDEGVLAQMADAAALVIGDLASD